VDSSRNWEEPNIESSKQPDSSSKDNLTLGLPTLNKMLEPNSLEPLPSLKTLAKKKLYYIIVPANKVELKKKIVGNIEERNVIQGKRLKERLKAYVGFLANVTKDKSLLA
jgi:hypothetical protein